MKIKFMCLLLIFALTVCFECKSDINTEELQLMRKAIADDYPRVDSSTSTHPLQRKLACDLLGLPWTWSAQTADNVQRTVVPDSSKNPDKKLAEQVLAITPSGTHGAYVNLIDNKTDVILVARAPSEDELKYAAEKNVVLDSRPCALDAFVFVVHHTNPVKSLSLSDIQKIYSGKIVSWSELGVQLPVLVMFDVIDAYQRNRNSGSQELMERLVMKGIPMTEAPDMITSSMLGPFNAIGGNRFSGEGGDPFGLGYSVFFYTKFMFPHSFVKMIGVNGTEPTSETIASQKYPLTAEVFVAVRQDMPVDSSAVLFRDWLFTEDGQSAIAESGYVPIK